MLPVLGDKGFFGERKKDDNQASIAISSGLVAELQGQTDKAYLFHSKAKLFCFPNAPSSRRLSHKAAVLVWSAAKQRREDPDSRAASNCAAIQQHLARRFKGYCGEIL